MVNDVETVRVTSFRSLGNSVVFVHAVLSLLTCASQKEHSSWPGEEEKKPSGQSTHCLFSS